MNLINSKKSQWARTMANDRRSIDRNARKTYARVLQLLGFSINEIVSATNISTQTVKVYLKETEGEVYSDLADQVYEPEVFNLFTSQEQKLIREFKDLQFKVTSFSAESKRIDKIIFKKNIHGWLVHKFGDVGKYKEKKKLICGDLKTLHKQAKNLLKKFSNKNISPHLSNSSLNFVVEIDRNWACEYCGKIFDTKIMAEKHELDCKTNSK